QVESHLARDRGLEQLGRFLIQLLDVNDLVREMSQLLETSISRKVALDLCFADPIPPIRGDATQIRQVVMNLIINASDAIGERSGHVTVRTGVTKIDNEIWDDNYFLERIADGLYVFFEVADDGCGMSEVTMRRIFDPFFTTKFTGRGLGLAATLGIIRSHKGAISVKSVVDQGTTFRVLIPASEGVATKPVSLTATARPAPRGISEPVPQQSEPLLSSKGLILLADDEAAIRSLAVKMVKRCGYDLILAADGVEACRLFRERHNEIGLIVLDLTMPRMSGEEAFRALRELDSEIPILISSGFDENDTMTRFVGAEHVAYLQKPFLFQDFSARLDEMIRGKRPTEPR
ncbi:MAG TPA: response regulator, partial [Candidatus Ozemobacteraceae bacterium]|nr:response regulator [Candidatus Ozemobacteraceae bacterium]